MDAARCEQAAVLGWSEGGPLAMLFAATYPERATALVLVSTFSRVQAPPEMDQLLDLAEEYWGSGHVLPFFAGECDRDWAARFERSASTPRGAVELLRLNVAMDVTAALPAITAPTLVIHRTGDPLVPVESAREMAAGIRGSRLVELPGHTHMPPDDRAWARDLDEVEEFLTGSRRTAPHDRVLATVLLTDIVGSTEQATSLGDERWRQRLEQLETDAHRIVAQFRGRAVKGTGDGTLATFDGPARAIRCASALVDRATTVGLPIRAGLHAGEVEILDRDIAGIAVHLAKRVEAAARPGTVWVSQTVHDLVVGSGITFVDRGVHELKGFVEGRRLYEVIGT
jgi:class 3 adenylate cyclase